MLPLIDPVALAGKVFSGGWREPAGGTVDVTEPATGKTLATVGLADAGDIASAASAAALAQPAWAAAAHTERAAVLRRAAQILEAHRDEVVGWLVREGGGVPGKAEHEVSSVLDELWVASGLPAEPFGQLLPSTPGRQSIGRRIPLGVVGVITPWNVPLLLAMRAVAPALALGNAVVLKPDVQTAVSGVSCSPVSSRRPASRRACCTSSPATPSRGGRWPPIPTSP
ncbi:aldehyde dehydrogenase family protein [Phytohabitans flavus]|uniref:aldehyde dehydrogenase family protein n=1 Tax=Phytohabitans flavus TaxID=1076124 RepID=UPI0036275899